MKIYLVDYAKTAVPDYSFCCVQTFNLKNYKVQKACFYKPPPRYEPPRKSRNFGDLGIAVFTIYQTPPLENDHFLLLRVCKKFEFFVS